MGVFDFLHPEIGQAKAIYDQAVNQYNQCKQRSNDLYAQYRSAVDLLSEYSIYNACLALSYTASKKSEDSFAEDLKNKFAPVDPDKMPKGMSSSTISYLENATGGSYVLNSIADFNSVTQDTSAMGIINTILGAGDGVENLLTGFAIGGIDVIPGMDKYIPPAVSMFLTLPLQIMAGGLAVAIDFGFSLFSPALIVAKYAAEQHDISQKTDQLSELVNNMENAFKETTDRILQQRTAYITMAGTLNSIVPMKFLQGLTESMSDQDLISSMQQAFSNFGILPIIRKDWINKSANDPSLTFADFKSDELEKLPRDQFSKDQLGILIDLIIKIYSK